MAQDPDVQQPPDDSESVQGSKPDQIPHGIDDPYSGPQYDPPPDRKYWIQCLSDAERAELEDFALECARSLIDRNAQGLFTTLLQIWAELGVDPAAMLTSLANERDEILRDAPPKKRLGPVQGFVLPTLKRCGLFSERVATHFHGFFRENFGDRVAGENVEVFMEQLPELPADTARWVMGEIQ